MVSESAGAETNLVEVRPERVFRIDAFSFDAERGMLAQGSSEQELSAREAEIVPTRTLLLDVWGDDSYFNARSLHVFITKLRRRLCSDPSLSIVNARGVGYKLMA